MAAHVLNLELQLALAALLRTLKGEVLQEVRGTVGPVGLGSASSIYPHSDSRSLSVW